MSKKVRIVITALSVLLVVSVLSLGAALLYNYLNPAEPSTVVVPNNLITPDKSASDGTQDTDDDATPDSSAAQAPADDPSAPSHAAPAASADDQTVTYAEALYLHTRNEGDNTPFKVTNMFPGDAETKYFCVRVAHKGDVVLRYHADIQPGYEKLAEVLKCKIVLPDSGETLYDGLMRDMPASLNRALPTDEYTVSEVYYEITAYLDTSVGNDYQEKELLANFRWWVEETENLGAPKTGSNVVLISASVAVLSLFFIILVGKRRSKEEADDAN